jgi:hypothetical protein
MATSITNKSKSEQETRDETNFKKLFNIWFFPRI